MISMKSKGLILFIFYFVTVLLVFYLCAIYKNSFISISDSNIDDVLISVTGNNYDELYSNISNYSKESHDFVVYVVSYKNLNVNSFESILKNNIISNNLTDKVLYINVDHLKKFNYLNRLVSDFGYSESISFDDLPIFILFHNEKIVEFISIGEMDYDSISNYLEDCYD